MNKSLRGCLKSSTKMHNVTVFPKEILFLLVLHFVRKPQKKNFFRKNSLLDTLLISFEKDAI